MMDTASAENGAGATSVGDVSSEFDVETDEVVFLEGESPNGEDVGDIGIIDRTNLTRLGLSLAAFSEKITNLSIFMMRLATVDSEFEAFALERDHVELDSVEKGLEFDLLSGILDSEVGELDRFLLTLRTEIADVQQRISSRNHLGETCMGMKEKVCDFEQYLKQSEEQFSVIKMQSANFQRNLSRFKREETGSSDVGKFIGEDNESFNMKPGINMHTAEQQRNILRMLEKSLAREIDLEKNLNDSLQTEEVLKLRITSLEQELVYAEEEAIDAWERWFEADSASQILMGISKDLLGRLQISQFNLNGFAQRESELRAKLDPANSEESSRSEKVKLLEKQLKESELQLLNTKASADEYQKLYNVLCSDVRDMENLIVELKENASKVQSRVDSAEVEHQLLEESNTKLNEELASLKEDTTATKKVELLERQLKESDLQLQHAIASAEASQEKQNMLYSTIEDMENVIRDLKSNVSKFESRADSAEEKCIVLSESNAELHEELSFLRSRFERLEETLHQVEKTKMATAKGIGMHIMNLKTWVTQLALERERLNKQISSLAFENKILAVKLEKTYRGPSQNTNDSNRESGSSAREIMEEVCETAVPCHKEGMTGQNSSSKENEMKPAEPNPDIETVRRTDAGALSFKDLLIAILVSLVSALTFLLLKDKNFDVMSVIKLMLG